MAGLGTTGVLVASFFLLLTVGSTLVAFRGVPGAPSNGDLSSIELRQQQQAAHRGTALLAEHDVMLKEAAPQDRDVLGDVLGQRASASRTWPTGQIVEEGAGSAGPDALRPGPPGTPFDEKAPPGSTPTPTPTPGTGVVESPVVPGTLADEGSGSGTSTPGDSTTTDGSTTDTGTSAGTDSGTGSSSGSGSDSSGTGDSGSGTSGSGGDVVDGSVDSGTDTVGSTVGTASPGDGQAVGDTGGTTGGLLDDATSAVGAVVTSG